MCTGTSKITIPNTPPRPHKQSQKQHKISTKWVTVILTQKQLSLILIHQVIVSAVVSHCFTKGK